jgi:hypothetical protein
VIKEALKLPSPGDKTVICDLLAPTDDLGDDPVLASGTSVLLRQGERAWTWWRTSLQPQEVTGAFVDDLDRRGVVRIHGSEALLSSVVDRLLDDTQVAR